MDRVLIVMRHGHYDSDDLSSCGERQADNTAQQIANDNFQPSLILHSPNPRAVQTAHRAHTIFSQLGKAPQMAIAEWLGLGSVDNHLSQMRVAAR